MKCPAFIFITLFLFFPSQLVLSQENEECLNLILSISDWKETPMTKWDYQKDGKSAALLYQGAEHLDDPRHNQFEKIRTRFEKFKPAVVFFEGPDRGIASSDTATIRQFGESGYARWLAKQAGLPVLTLEPSFADLYGYLLSKYPQEQVDLYMYMRETSRLFHRKKMNKEQVMKVITQMMETVPAMTVENKPLLVSLPMVETAYKKYFTSSIEWWQVPQNFFDPAKTGSTAHFTNELAALSSAYRNISMVQKLAEQVNAGKRVFAVVGKNHVPLQAAALDCAIK
jgi:hypothetical protein